MRISSQSLFIRDLGQDFRSDALNRNDSRSATTMAIGEEGGEATTMALGEEDGGEVTTMAVGEEGGGEVTTMALGEEGCAGAELGCGPGQLEQLLELYVSELGQ